MEKIKKAQRDFKGVWIPKEIWLDEKLTLQERVFLVEIDSLDNSKGCFANNNYFAKFFGISKDRASRVISELQKKGKIEIELDKVAKNKDKRVIRIIGKIQRGGIGGNTNTGIGGNNEGGIGGKSEHSNTTVNNTIINNNVSKSEICGKDFNDLLDLFKAVNPSHYLLFKNKSQRAALERLVKKWGKEKIEAAINTLPDLIGKKYAPVINTPYQLEVKFGDLVAYLQKERGRGDNKIIKLI